LKGSSCCTLLRLPSIAEVNSPCAGSNAGGGPNSELSKPTKLSVFPSGETFGSVAKPAPFGQGVDQRSLVAAVGVHDPDAVVEGVRVEALEHDLPAVRSERRLAAATGRVRGQVDESAAVRTDQRDAGGDVGVELEHDLPPVRRPVRVDGVADGKRRDLLQVFAVRADGVQLGAGAGVGGEGDQPVVTGGVASACGTSASAATAAAVARVRRFDVIVAVLLGGYRRR
jgi:hypothetical protein